MRWLAALHRGDARAALADDVRIERFDPVKRGTAALKPVEVFEGIEAAKRWLERTPATITFTLAGEPIVEGDRIIIDYIYSFEDFSNGGTWILRVANDKIASLAHRPYELRDP